MLSSTAPLKFLKTGDGKYLYCKINSKSYLLHRLAFLYVNGRWPIGDIDHINGIGRDNRFCNLREAHRKLNMLNRKKYATNTSGVKGVSFHKQSGMWRARVQKFGNRESLGLYRTLGEAMAAYDVAAEKTFGVYGRQNVHGHMERSEIHDKMRELSRKKP